MDNIKKIRVSGVDYSVYDEQAHDEINSIDASIPAGLTENSEEKKIYLVNKNGENIGEGVSALAGADGKSAYEFAVEGGYEGTEAEFAEKMVKAGEYEIIDFGGFNFTAGSDLETEEVRKIGETTKSILITGIRINGEVKNDVYVEVMRDGYGLIYFYMYNLYFIIPVSDGAVISCAERLKFGTGVLRITSDNTSRTPTDEFSIPFIDDYSSWYIDYSAIVEDIEYNPNFIIIMERNIGGDMSNLTTSTVFRLLSINGTGNVKTYIFEGVERNIIGGPTTINNKYYLYIKYDAAITNEFVVVPTTATT